MALVGEKLELEIADLGHDGQGVGRHDGQVVFVAGGLPGDRLQVRLVARSKRHLVGQLQRVIRPSEQRRRPPCILADHCGGCSLQPLNDAAQAEWKQRAVEQTLQRIAGLQATVSPLLKAESGLGYRNRALIPLERKADGHLRAGYYRRGSHRIVNMARCPVLDPRIDALIAPIKLDLESSDWPVDRHGGGGLRHLGLRVGSHTGELLITLIAGDDDLPGLADMAAGWMERWQELVGVCLNLQPQPTNLLMGTETRVVAGRGWLAERFAGLQLRIASDTFFQVNTVQAERLVPHLIEALGAPSGRLLDAYCGIGTYSLPLAAAGWRVHGLEHHETAVALARENARANGLGSHASFEQAEVCQGLAHHLAAGDALFIDPPRKGLDGASLATILRTPPRRMAYLSCDPASLARDLARLVGEGPYRLRSLQPIDFFPNTSHVETLAVLELA
jgi:23S rRNA (uracil1939-C5)-methyltransferase